MLFLNALDTIFLFSLIVWYTSEVKEQKKDGVQREGKMMNWERDVEILQKSRDGHFKETNQRGSREPKSKRLQRGKIKQDVEINA